ncbi:MAG: aminotransferase class IV family protein [Bryobacteraceae bacterium]|nr:aminotransferase class IV family protein [Bryobacteraceae bacterium]
MHRYILHNDAIRDASEPCLTPGQVGLLTGWGVFSTIRVRNGVLFAFERHFARMERDAERMHVPFPTDPEWMEERLLRLVAANHAENATLRVNVVRNKGGLFHMPVPAEFDIIAMTADLVDWGAGVRLGVVPNARHARSMFAGAKVTSWAFNLTWYEQAHAHGFDEVILLDESGFVSECTSANVFAVFGDEVATPPLSCGCLAGITRDLLLTEIVREPYRIIERALTLAELEAADEVFLTSTTRDLLPVNHVDGLTIRRNGKACHELREAFRAHLDSYVSSRSTPVEV